MKEPRFSRRFLALYFFLLAGVFYARLLQPGKILNAYDQISAGFAGRAFWIQGLKHLQLWFWNPTHLSGLPTIQTLQSEALYPSVLLGMLFPVDLALGIDFVLHTFLAGLFFYLLLGLLDLRRSTRVLFASLYALSGPMTSMAYAGHNAKVHALTLYPLFVYFALRATQRQQLRMYALAGGVLGWIFLGQHAQMAYYAFLSAPLLIVLYTLLTPAEEHPRLSWGRTLIGLGVLGFLGLLISSIQLIPAWVYTRTESFRAVQASSLAYSATWSMPWADLISAWIPRFSGFSLPPRPDYWAENVFKHNSEFLGVLTGWMLMLSAVYLRPVKRREFWTFALTAVFFLLIALGDRTPVFALFYAVLPMFSKLRAHGMAYGIALTYLVLLGALTFEVWLDRKASLPKWALALAAFLVLIGLVGMADPPTYARWLRSLFSVQDPGKYRALIGGARHQALAVLYTGLALGIYAYLVRARVWMGVLGLSLLEMFVVHQPFTATQDRLMVQLPPDAAVRWIRQHHEARGPVPPRVLPLGYHTADQYWVYHGITTLAGQNPTPPRHYMEFLGSETAMLSLASFQNLYRNPRLLYALATDYLLAPVLPPPESLPRYAQHPAYSLILALSNLESQPFLDTVLQFQTREGPFFLFRLKQPASLVAFYRQALVYDSARVLQRLTDPTFDPRQELVLTRAPGVEALGAVPGAPDTTLLQEQSLTPADYRPGYLRVEIRTDRPGYVVFRENWSREWEARVDGEPVPIARAFHTFQAVRVDPGAHVVEWVYRGQLERISLVLSVLGLLLWGVLLLAGSRLPEDTAQA